MTDKKYTCTTCVWIDDEEGAPTFCNYTPPELIDSAGDVDSHFRETAWRSCVASLAAWRRLQRSLRSHWCPRWQGGDRDAIFAARMKNTETNLAIAGRDEFKEQQESMQEDINRLVSMVEQLREDQRNLATVNTLTELPDPSDE